MSTRPSGDRSSSGVHHVRVPSAVGLAAPKPNKAHTGVQTKIKIVRPAGAPKPRGSTTSTSGNGSAAPPRTTRGTHKARHQPKHGPNLDTTRSANDKKHYRHVTLANGLECVLISTLNAPDSKVGASVGPDGLTNFASSMDIAINDAAENLNGTADGHAHTHMHAHGHAHSLSKGALGMRRNPSLVKEFNSRPTSLVADGSSMLPPGLRIPSRRMMAVDQVEATELVVGGEAPATGTAHSRTRTLSGRLASANLRRSGRSSGRFAVGGGTESGGEAGEDDVVVELDSTSIAVEELHARAFSESQKNLHATAEEIVQEAKMKKHMGRGSKGTMPMLPNTPKAGADGDRFAGISHRAMGSSARGLVLSTGEGGEVSSVGTSKRSSIPSLTLAASLAATGQGLMRTNTAGSAMNLFDVPHLDRPSKTAQATAQQARISSRIPSQGRMAAASSVSLSPDMDEPAEVVGVRMAAVSLAVGVGSFSTPDGFDGLAHFLEHMLFMGSERFPAENAFDAFLAQAGGNSNAYTDTEKTVYHFTCPQEHLRHALDIFAQFFISPLLLPEAADRELKSIESEFTLRQNMDGCRLQEIWRHTSRKGTPFAKFTCGNMQTLRDWPLAAGKDVNKALWAFYKKYYVAPNMKLCILGIDSLDALEGLSVDLFSPVRDKPLSSSSDLMKYAAVDFSERGVPWVGVDPSVQSLAQVWPQIIKAQREKRNLPDVLSELETQRVNGGLVVSADADAVAKKEKRKSSSSNNSRRRSKTRNAKDDTEAAAAAAAAKPPVAGEDGVALGCLFRIVPVQDMHELSLTWQLPPLAGLYMSKPTEYISHLIGHESAGSILAEAKARGWATALIASSVTGDGFEHNTACTMFNINVTLTRQGLNEWVYVVGMIFEYIGMLIRVGPQKRVHDELRAVSKMQYEFQEEPDALMLAQNLSVWMLPQSKYKPEHLLTGPWLNFDWDPVLINNTLYQLSPKLVRLDLMSSVYGHSDEYAGASKSPVPEPINADKSNEESIEWLSERPTRAPISEPFTGAQYWVDKIPDSVTSLWKELYLGRATVGFTESGGEEKSTTPNNNNNNNNNNNKDGNSFPRSLALPPRNPYISTDFSLRKPPASDPKHPLVGAIIKVCRPVELLGSTAAPHTVSLKRAASLKRSASLVRGSISESGTSDSRVMSSNSKKKNKFLQRASMDKRGGVTEWTKASILEVNESDNMILVQYAMGEYRWHELPRDKVDWKSVPSSLSTRRVSVLKKLQLDGSIQFEIISMSKWNKNKKQIDDNNSAAGGSEVSGGSGSSNSSSKGKESRRSKGRNKKGKSASSRVKKTASDRARAESNLEELNDNSTDLVTFSQFGGGANTNALSVEAGPAARSNKRRTPAMVAHSDNLFTLWHLQDLEFRTPRCEVYLNFVSPVANASPLLASLHDLLALMIFESLNQDSYMAFISELELEIETSGTGLQVHVGGFSHKLPVLLDNVINRLLQFAMLDREHDTGAIINLADSALSAAARKSGRRSGRGHGRGDTSTSIGSNLSRKSKKNKNDTRSMRSDSTSSKMSNKQRVGSTGTGISKRTSKITRSGPQQEQQQRQAAAAGAMMPTQLIESPVFYAQLESLVTNYINAGSQFRSSGQVSTAMFQILCRDLWSPDVKVSFAAYITPNLLKEYAVKFLSECRVQGLVYGNITLGESQTMLHKVKDALHNAGIEPIAETKIPVLEVLKVPIAPPLVRNSTIHGMVHVLEALESPAHSVELYFQIGDDVLEERVLACTIEQIMKEPLYAELRTKQQLGYSVKCGVRSICGTLGFVVEITSEVHGPELLCQDVDNFLTTFRESLANISETDLGNHVAALSRNLTEKENGLGETALKFWNTVANKQHHKPPRYAWHYEVEQAQALERRVTRERLLNSFDKWLSPASTQRRRLSVLVVGFGYDTTELVRMLEMPCVTLVESAQETHDAEAQRVQACKCSIM